VSAQNGLTWGGSAQLAGFQGVKNQNSLTGGGDTTRPGHVADDYNPPVPPQADPAPDPTVKTWCRIRTFRGLVLVHSVTTLGLIGRTLGGRYRASPFHGGGRGPRPSTASFIIAYFLPSRTASTHPGKSEPESLPSASSFSSS
jgi:hypothetical protein